MEENRVDKMLVHLGLAQTRSKASQMIERGEVFYQNKQVTKASQVVSEKGLEVRSEFVYVGRGAYKLLEAVKKFSLNLNSKVVADIGASTGGFTQVSLMEGAEKVYAVDVGHGQLDPILIADDRVINLEGTNIRQCESLGELVDVIVTDLSFISLEIVLEDILKHLKKGGEGVFLVKPQFELDKKSLGKKGVVKDSAKLLSVLEKYFDLLRPQGICLSPIKGKEGNKEFLFYYIEGTEKAALDRSELRKFVTES